MSNYGGPPATPPGWYPDGAGGERWWDGTRWTDQQRPAGGSSGDRFAPPGGAVPGAGGTAQRPDRPRPTQGAPLDAADMPTVLPGVTQRPSGPPPGARPGPPPGAPQQGGPQPWSPYPSPPGSPGGSPPGSPGGSPYGSAYGAPGGPEPYPAGPYPAGPYAAGPAYAPRRRSLLWLWVTLAVVAVIVLGTATTLAVVRPWEGDASAAGDRGESGDRDEGGDASAEPEPADGPVTGDIDGDGHGDAVGVLSDEGDLTRFTLTGTGTSFDVASEPISIYEDRLWADWDGDGALDSFTWETEGGDRLNLEPEGSDMEAASYDGFGLSDEYGFLVLNSGDVDGDGDEDLLAHGQTTKREVTVWVLINEGDGAFADPQEWAVLDDATYSSVELYPSDYDGDGDDDVLARVPAEPVTDEYYYGSYAVQLLTSTGSSFDLGTEGPRLKFESSDLSGVLAPGDFRGDGTTTFVTFVTTGSPVTVGLLEFDGTTLVPDDAWTRTLEGDSDGYISPAVASDVDGDGVDDIVYVHNGDTRKRPFDGFRVVRSEGDGFAESEVWGDTPRCSGEFCFMYFQSTSG